MADLTDQVRYAWCWYGGASRPESDERAAEFDRWLAAHDRQVRAQALRDAAEWMDLPGSDATGYYASEHDSGYREASRHAEEWLRDHADAEERGE